MTVWVCFSPAPRQVCELALQLAPGSSLRQALALAVQQAHWPQGWPEARCLQLTPGLWNRKAGWDTLLRPGDRVELYRPLQVDPKVARRQRFARQGARRAGLFARKRPGTAAGN